MDEISLQRIAQAHPKIRAELLKIYKEANNALGKNVRLRFTHVLRTFKEQDDLFAKGRTTGKKGAIVTQSKGGQSYHNYALAVDFCLLIDTNGDGTFDKVSFDPLRDFDGDRIADWKEVVSVFKKYGYEWGGDWRFKDMPHFQKTFGYNWRKLLELYKAGKVDKQGYVLI